MYLWATLFSGTVVWLSIANTQIFVLAVATAGAVLTLLLMSMPRLRWWDRRGPGQPASRAGPAGGPGPQPGGEPLAPLAAGEHASRSR